MFTLNDFVLIVNKILDEDRKAKGLNVNGYFSSVEELKYADSARFPEYIEILIRYFSDNKTSYPVIRVCRSLSSKVDISVEEKKASKMALEYFYKFLRYGTGEYDYSKFVDGTFNYIPTVE